MPKRTQAEIRGFLQTQAERMRLNPTDAELALRGALELMGFYGQSVIRGQTKNGGQWSYIVDYLNPKAGIAVEVDGPIHNQRRGRDRRRDARLRMAGVLTIRFSNKQVLEQLDWVIDEIKLTLASRVC